MSVPNSAGLLSVDNTVPANSAGAAVQLSKRLYRAATVWISYSASALTAGGSLTIKFDVAESTSGPWFYLSSDDVTVSLDGVNAQAVQHELTGLHNAIAPYVRARTIQALTAGGVGATLYLQDD